MRVEAVRRHFAREINLVLQFSFNLLQRTAAFSVSFSAGFHAGTLKMSVKIFASTRSVQVHIAYRSHCSHVLGQRRKRSRSKTEERAVESAHPGTSREVYLDSEGQAGRQARQMGKPKTRATLFFSVGRPLQPLLRWPKGSRLTHAIPDAWPLRPCRPFF